MKKKVILFLCILIFVYAAGGTIYYIATREKKDDKPIVTNKDTIKGYDYTLKSNATKLYEDEFKTLKANLEGDINYDEYAVSIAKLFVIDLYTINNKINKYDTGGASFVYPDGRDNYKLNVQDTIYKYVEDNTNGKRTQNLPEVSSVIVKDSKKDTYFMPIRCEEFLKRDKSITSTSLGNPFNVDYKTAKKIIDDLNKYLKNSGFTVDNKYVNTNIDPNEDYEPIGKMVNKFLETAGIHAFIKDKSSSKNERIYITVGMNCINVDAPEFKDYYQPDKFTVYLDTNIIFKIQKYVKSTQELRQNILSNVRTIIKKDINQNWQFIDFTEKEQD